LVYGLSIHLNVLYILLNAHNLYLRFEQRNIDNYGYRVLEISCEYLDSDVL